MFPRVALLLVAALLGAPPSTAEIRAGGYDDPAAGEVARFEIIVPVSASDVWRALTNPTALSRWLAPVVEADLRIGGTITTHIDPEGKIGAPGTERRRIASALDRQLLVLRPEPSGAWPERIRAQSGNLQEILLLEDLGGRRTRLTVTIAGWGTGPAWEPIRASIRDERLAAYTRLDAMLDPRATEDR